MCLNKIKRKKEETKNQSIQSSDHSSVKGFSGNISSRQLGRGGYCNVEGKKEAA